MLSPCLHLQRSFDPIQTQKLLPASGFCSLGSERVKVRMSDKGLLAISAGLRRRIVETMNESCPERELWLMLLFRRDVAEPSEEGSWKRLSESSRPARRSTRESLSAATPPCPGGNSQRLQHDGTSSGHSQEAGRPRGSSDVRNQAAGKSLCAYEQRDLLLRGDTLATSCLNQMCRRCKRSAANPS